MGLQNTYEQVINNLGLSILVVASSRYAPPHYPPPKSKPYTND